MSPELTAALDKIKARRGTGQEWLAQEVALMHFMAGLHDSTRVFARGTVHLDTSDHPAILTYNSGTRQTWAWAPSGRKGAIESHHEGRFWPIGCLKSATREALSGPETCTGIATPALVECVTLSMENDARLTPQG